MNHTAGDKGYVLHFRCRCVFTEESRTSCQAASDIDEPMLRKKSASAALVLWMALLPRWKKLKCTRGLLAWSTGI